MVCSKISASGAQWVFANGKATIVASGSSQQGIYQAVNVVAGQKYSIDMVASSDTPLVNTWFEVYVLNTAPVTGQDVAEQFTEISILGMVVERANSKEKFRLLDATDRKMAEFIQLQQQEPFIWKLNVEEVLLIV
jgi:hypothetical protein